MKVGITQLHYMVLTITVRQYINVLYYIGKSTVLIISEMQQLGQTVSRSKAKISHIFSLADEINDCRHNDIYFWNPYLPN